MPRLAGNATTSTPRGSRPLLPVAVGAYYCSERKLYRVEHLGEERAIVEDCRTLELIDLPLPELLALRRVRDGIAAA